MLGHGSPRKYRARSPRERVGRESAVEHPGQEPAEVVAVAERVEVGIAAGQRGVVPPGGDGLPQGPDRLVGQLPPSRLPRASATLSDRSQATAYSSSESPRAIDALSRAARMASEG